MSKATIILGSQWGDEGKGKIVDLLATEANVVCRFNGGNNAGHTVIANGVEYDFHMLPTGIINEDCVSVIGNGCVIHLPDMLKEVAKNEAKGLKNWKSRLYISDRAHLVFDLHQEIDGLVEGHKGKDNLGTTKKGIGPTYASKATRNGIRVCDLVYDFEIFETKFRALVKYNKEMYASLTDINIEEEIERYRKIREEILPCIKDVTFFMSNIFKQENQNVIIEGANAAMLDIDFGTYPYVTSSNCTIGGICSGLGVLPKNIGQVIAIVKAYTTRVGLGAFATELTDEIGDYLQTVGKEFGVTTGRKRRCGWLDLVVLKYTNMINGYTQLAITKLDVMDQLKEIKIGIAYRYNGKVLDSFPACINVLEKVEVEYVTFPGWMQSISNCKSFDQLPENARNYLNFIEETLQVPSNFYSFLSFIFFTVNLFLILVKYIGVGKEREAVIIKN